MRDYVIKLNNGTSTVNDDTNQIKIIRREIKKTILIIPWSCCVIWLKFNVHFGKVSRHWCLVAICVSSWR